MSSKSMLSAGLAGALLLSPAVPAAAAVKVCRNSQSSGIVAAETEPAGKKLALERWSAKARTFGGGYASWGIANHKMVKCVKARSGRGFECIAVGAPCVIQQVPPKRKRFDPKAPIET